MIITQRLIDLAFQSGACLEAIRWLNQQQRTVEDLCKHSPWARWVAENRHAPPAVLSALATDQVADVRWGVAQNPSTHAETLTTLATDQVAYVRWGVAQNPSTHAQAQRDARRSCVGAQPTASRRT